MVKILESQIRQRVQRLNLIKNLMIGKEQMHTEECTIMKLVLDNTTYHSQYSLKRELFQACETLLECQQVYPKLRIKAIILKTKMTTWEVQVQDLINIIQILKASKIQSLPFQYQRVNDFTSLVVLLTFILNCKLIKIIFFNLSVIFHLNLDQRAIRKQKPKSKLHNMI